MPDLVAVIREAGPPDRDSIWPLARGLATSFAVDRDAFNSTLDAIGSDENTLLLSRRNLHRASSANLLANSHLTRYSPMGRSRGSKK